MSDLENARIEVVDFRPWRGPDALFLLPDAAKRLLDEEEWFFSGHGTSIEGAQSPWGTWGK